MRSRLVSDPAFKDLMAQEWRQRDRVEPLIQARTKNGKGRERNPGRLPEGGGARKKVANQSSSLLSIKSSKLKPND